MATLKIMVTTNKEQRLLFMLFNLLVISVICYVLGILTLCITRCEKLDKKVQNARMRIGFGCTRDTTIRAMTYLLVLTSERSRHSLAQVNA